MAYLVSLISGLLLLIAGMSLPGCVAVCIAVFWFAKLFQVVSYRFPVKEIMLSFYALQFLMVPAFVYNGLEEYVYYKMKVNEDLYFSMMIPAFISFVLGINWFTKGKNLYISRASIHAWVSAKPLLPYYLIGAGFILPLLTGLLPSAFNFVLYALSSLKFIGLFILILSYVKVKPIVLAAVYGSVFIGSFAQAMFHDLVVWLVMLGCMFAYRYKPSTMIKVVSLAGFTLFILLIQSIKSEYRSVIWNEGKRASLDIVSASVQKVQQDKGGILAFENLAPQVTRINQGWILAGTMNNVPASVPHSNGELTKRYLEAAFLPRFLAKDKLRAGDKEIFNRYSGHLINESTSMGLGLFTDAYVEFGSLGANLYVFAFGLLYGFILSRIVRYSRNYPVLILFAAMLFVYPIRPDCETQVVLGHLMKTSLIIYLLFFFFKDYFYFPQNRIANRKESLLTPTITPL